MTTRIRRAAASVPANIAEGNDRENRRDVTKIALGRQGAPSPGAPPSPRQAGVRGGVHFHPR